MEWADYEIELLRLCYSHTTTKAIAKYLGRTESSVYQRARNMGLSKDPALNRHVSWATRKQNGKLHGFQKGQKAWNQGLHYHPSGSEKTWFPKGHMPKNWRPIGSERRDRDGIWVRKVANTRDRKTDWRPIHYLMWEEHHGAVPEDHIIVFKNKNHDDLRIENLEAITRAENMLRNQYQRYPEPIAKAIQMRGALNRQINQRQRNEKQAA